MSRFSEIFKTMFYEASATTLIWVGFLAHRFEVGRGVGKTTLPV